MKNLGQKPTELKQLEEENAAMEKGFWSRCSPGATGMAEAFCHNLTSTCGLL